MKPEEELLELLKINRFKKVGKEEKKSMIIYYSDYCHTYIFKHNGNEWGIGTPLDYKSNFKFFAQKMQKAQTKRTIDTHNMLKRMADSGEVEEKKVRKS